MYAGGCQCVRSIDGTCAASATATARPDPILLTEVWRTAISAPLRQHPGFFRCHRPKYKYDGGGGGGGGQSRRWASTTRGEMPKRRTATALRKLVVLSVVHRFASGLGTPCRLQLFASTSESASSSTRRGTPLRSTSKFATYFRWIREEGGGCQWVAKEPRRASCKIKDFSRPGAVRMDRHGHIWTMQINTDENVSKDDQR